MFFLSNHFRTKAQLFISFQLSQIEACTTEQYRILCHKTSAINPKDQRAQCLLQRLGWAELWLKCHFSLHECATGPESLHRGRRRKLDGEGVLGETARFRD